MSSQIHSIGIIGYGSFGKLFAEICKRAFPNASLIIFSSKTHSNEGMTFGSLNEVSQSDLLVPCVPIHAFDEVITRCLPYLGPQTMVMSICSVMMYPEQLLSKRLSADITRIVTHPLFGPSSINRHENPYHQPIIAYHSLKRDSKVNVLLDSFAGIGFRMYETTSRAHDREMAHSQLLTHLCARGLTGADFQVSELATPSAYLLGESMALVGHTDTALCSDMYHYNPFSKKVYDAFLSSIQIH